MLTGYLGFDAADVGMPYFNDEPKGKRGVCSGGQAPPSVPRFEKQLTRPLKEAQAGDVRFLYVDTQGTQKGGDKCKPNDGKDGGWMLAEGDCGTKELVTNGWISEAIREVRAACSPFGEVWNAVLRRALSEPQAWSQPLDPRAVMPGWRDHRYDYSYARPPPRRLP